MSSTAWRESLSFRDAETTFAPALRVGIATTIALVVFGLLGRADLAGLAALGAVSSAFARHEPYGRQASKIVLVAASTVVFVALGGALGIGGWPVAATIAILSVAAGLGFQLLVAFRIPGPGPVILVFAGAGAAGSVTTASGLVAAVGATALGGVVGLALAVCPVVHHPYGPGRLAVARALATVARIERDGDRAVDSARHAISLARQYVSSAGGRRSEHRTDLLALLDAAESYVDDGPHDDRTRRDEFARYERELRRIRRDIDIPRADPGAEVREDRPEGVLADGVRRLTSRDVTVGAARVVVASAAAGWVAAALGFDHPLWATMGAMAVLQGANYRHTVQRAIQRLLGNAAGALLAAAVIVWSPGYWWVVAFVAVCATLAEVFAPRSYAVTSVAVTAMALMVTGLGLDLTPGVAVSRLVDTAVGVVVGVVVAAVTIDRDDTHHLGARALT